MAKIWAIILLSATGLIGVITSNTNADAVTENETVNPTPRVYPTLSPSPTDDKPIKTIWHPVSLAENKLTKYYFKKGEQTEFVGTIGNYKYNEAQNVTIAIDIYDQNNNKVAGQVFEEVWFKPMESKNFKLLSPKTLDEGQYYFAVGVYQSETDKLLGWYPKYQNFTVTN